MANAFFDEVTGLLQCRLRGGYVPQAIQEAEVMDLTDVPCCDDIDAGLIQFAGVSLTLVTENIILFRLNECGRQAG